MMRAAQEAIDNYRRQTLQNAYSDVGVSRLGADLMREENARAMATSVDALRSGGIRGLGMIGQVQQNTNRLNQGLAADLDRQQYGLNMARAQDTATMRAMQEQREMQDLAGLGRQLEAGRQDYHGGLQDVSQGLLSMGAIGANALGGGMTNPFGGGGSKGLPFTFSSPNMGALQAGMPTMGSLTGVRDVGQSGIPLLGQSPDYNNPLTRLW